MSILKLSDIKKFNAPIFDLDGTLVQSSQEATGAKALLKKFVTQPYDDRFRKYLQFKAAQSTLSKRRYINHAGIMLPKIKELGKPMGLVTGTPGHLMRHYYNNQHLNAEAPFLKMFNCIITGGMVQNPKPDLEGYLLALEIMGLKGKDCIAFEDSIEGVDAALTAGLNVCSVGEADCVADFHINDFADLEKQ